MQLVAGQTAPNFSARDVRGNVISLRGFKDKKLALLFYRYAGCPFCQLNFHNFMREYPRYAEHGLNVIVFFQSPQESISRYISSQNAPFAIVADPNKSIYLLYGVESSLLGLLRTIPETGRYLRDMLPSQGKIDGDFFLMPAGFLIDGSDFTIKKVHYATSLTDQISLQEIHEFLFDQSG